MLRYVVDSLASDSNVEARIGLLFTDSVGKSSFETVVDNNVVRSWLVLVTCKLPSTVLSLGLRMELKVESRLRPMSLLFSAVLTIGVA